MTLVVFFFVGVLPGISTNQQEASEVANSTGGSGIDEWRDADWPEADGSHAHFIDDQSKADDNSEWGFDDVRIRYF